MARVKLNSLLADLRGRLGSVVFSSNASGGHCYIYTPPIRRKNSRNASPELFFSTLVSSWSYLTPIQRAAWSTYAQQADNERQDWFGDPYFPSSRAQFISINMARLQSSYALTAVPPAGALPAPLPAFSAGVFSSSDVSDSYIDPNTAFDPSISYVYVSGVIAFSSARTTPPSDPHFFSIIPVTDPWPLVLNSYFSAVYGVVPDSGAWWIRLYPVSSEFRFGTGVYYTAAIGEEV